MKPLLYAGAVAILAAMPAAAEGDGFPAAEVSNGVIRAKVYLPDAEKGSYRGNRFDWSGIVVSLEYRGHTYFGQWYAKHDPLVNDAVAGPATEFFTQAPGVGYDAANPGSPYLRIGAGVVQRPAERDASGRRPLRIIDSGKWTVQKGDRWIEFTHELSGANGYGYVYTKRLALDPRQPEMTVSQTFRNTGSKLVEADPYNHNFFMLDAQPSGPGIVVRFPFAPRAVSPLKDLVEIRGNEIHYLKELQTGESVLTLLEGFGGSAKDYNIVVENRTSGAGVEVTGDQPLSRLQFWSIRTTVCPEPFIKVRAEPGQTVKWGARYRFYTTK